MKGATSPEPEPKRHTTGGSINFLQQENEGRFFSARPGKITDSAALCLFATTPGRPVHVRAGANCCRLSRSHWPLFLPLHHRRRSVDVDFLQMLMLMRVSLRCQTLPPPHLHPAATSLPSAPSCRCINARFQVILQQILLENICCAARNSSCTQISP